MNNSRKIEFRKKRISAKLIDPSGRLNDKIIEVRTNPITYRSSRITYSRIGEKEVGTGSFREPPPFAFDSTQCPFCHPQVFERTPKLNPLIFSSDRMMLGDSILFPNLFPYGGYSAVSLFDQAHFVEIGSASLTSYRNSFKNSIRYLQLVLNKNSQAIYMAITQNHLPSAGGSLLHPHLQVHADTIPGNHHRFLVKRCRQYYRDNKELLLSDYLNCELEEQKRYIGVTGDWHWVTAFAPEGFFEIWGILPGITSLQQLQDKQIKDLCSGILNAQRFYRSLKRNGYNLGVLCVEDEASCLELRVVMIVRSNYAPWVRNDHTSYEIMLGDMATFVAPEITAELARPFWDPKTE